MIKMMTETTGITDVAHVLQHLGVDVRRIGENEISARCPVHFNRVGKEDASPSWSMNAHTGLWLCYSCGAKGTLSSLVSELTGESDSIVAVHSFIVAKGLERLNSIAPLEKKPTVDWKSFSSFPAPSDEWLFTRGIDRDSAREYGIRFDEGKQAWILPIVSPMGELLGWQEKQPSQVRNYPIGVKKSETLFGIDKADCTIGVLVESPLDAARLATVVSGVCGVASYGAHISKQQIRLLVEHFDGLIIALDNDSAGISAAQKLQKALPAFRHGVNWLHYAHTDAKDIGEMTHAQIITAVSQASVFPWWLDV
jgi:5S rRNA maturation endonuclease (ribonuclease M5)